ncbi:MAG TPA: hypothetical protein VF192_14365 [Longimicrobiales bacterium]
MTSPHDPYRDPPKAIPLGQRLYDNWLLLLVVGILVMVLIYTGWGLWEVLTLPLSALP